VTTTASSALEASVVPLLEAGAAALAEQLGLPVEIVLGPADIGEGAFAAAVAFEGTGNGVYVVDPAVLTVVEGAPPALDDAAAQWVRDTILKPLAAGAVEVIASLTGEPASAPQLAAIDAAVANQEGAASVPFTLLVGGTTVAALWAFEESMLPLLAGGEELPPPSTPGPAREDNALSVQPAALPELGPGTGTGPERAISMLAAVGVDVTVELGGTRLRMRDLLSLHEGSVVPLDQPAGSSVDVLVNGTVIARGDVVVVENELGVRITEMVERA
jgi:flagellar motor switch protein FliN/FliY